MHCSFLSYLQEFLLFFSISMHVRGHISLYGSARNRNQLNQIACANFEKSPRRNAGAFSYLRLYERERFPGLPRSPSTADTVGVVLIR